MSRKRPKATSQSGNPAKGGKRGRPPRGAEPDAVPSISHLQFLVLGVLLSTERRGHEIRAELAGFGVSKSGPAFYQMMARLEDGELIEGRYSQEIIDGQIIRERVYKIRAEGQGAWSRCRDFQMSVIQRLGGQAGVAHA